MNEIMYSKSLSEEIYCELGKINYRRKRNWLHYGYMFISKWESEINIDINLDNVFLICSLVTNNFKLKQFQFKLFYQMLPTQIFSKIVTKNVDLCSFCKCITDSILHYTISYIGFRQVIRAHITCLCFIFPEPKAREIYNIDRLYEPVIPV